MNNFIKRFLTSVGLIIFFLTGIFLHSKYTYFFLFIILLLSLLEIIKLKSNFIKLFILLIIFLFLFSFFNLIIIDNGKFFVLWVLFITWITDSGCYILGKLFGKKKIKYISPNKTYFGFFGGIILSQTSYLLAELIEQNIFNLSVYKIIYIQLTTSLAVIFGDLLFSFFKRKLNIKDYSNFLPGHGGVLDRLDGLFLATIYFYFIFIL